MHGWYSISKVAGGVQSQEDPSQCACRNSLLILSCVVTLNGRGKLSAIMSERIQLLTDDTSQIESAADPLAS